MHSSFKTLFEGSDPGCEGAITAPAYAANGSGNGLASAGAGGGNATLACVVAGTCRNPLAAGVRDQTVAFQGTDEPPTPQQLSDIQAGTSSPADDAIAHLVPVATGSSVFIMHAPEGCDISTVRNLTGAADPGGLNDLLATGDSAGRRTQRIRLTASLLERAWAGEARTWGDIAPGISGNGTGIAAGDDTNVGRSCATIPVRRIVRVDRSGTTYGWKAYLNLINGTRGWLTTFSTGDNTFWPSAADGSRVQPQQATGRGCTTAAQLCSSTSSGNGGLASAVVATDGSIGYGDLATDRGASFDITADVAPYDYTFWSPLQNNPGATATGYAEPTLDPLAHSGSRGAKGANCQRVAVANVPSTGSSPGGDRTRGDWSTAYAAGGAAYPACVLTYILAWDDNAPVYGNTAAEEAEARTVKDYLAMIVSTAGQVSLLGADYSPLPNSVGTPLLSIAQTGVSAIDWNKTAGGGGGGGGTGGGGGGGTPGPGPGPGPSAPPSNQFSIPSSSVSARLLSFTLELPGGGTLTVKATAKVGRRTITVGSANARAAASGRVRVRLTPSSAARRALASARGRRLAVKVTFTYTPTGGSARTVTKTVTLRAAARRARRAGRGGRR